MENKTKKWIYVADILVITVSLFAVLWMVGYARPLVIAPVDNYSTSETVLFSFVKADVILIDDNFNFTSPMKIYARDNLAVNLEPGRYYWKLDGILPSEIRTLQIESKVELKLKETRQGYELVNGGNTNLNVKVYSNGSKMDEMLLKPSENNTVSGDKVVGGQNEN